MEFRNQNFVSLEPTLNDFRPKFLVAMDSSRSSSERLKNNEIVFLDGSLNGTEEDEGFAVNSSDNTYDDDDDDVEPAFFVEGDEVDLSQPDDGIVHMELATEIDDSDEPYQDSNGALYYICEKCTFVCIDHSTLVQHTNEKHPKNQPPPRPRNNNSALRSSNTGSYFDDFIHIKETVLSQENVTSTSLLVPSVQPVQEPSPSPSLSPSPPPLQPLSPSPQFIDDQKPYECKICHKRLSTRANLRGHLTIHSNDKPFACDLCSKRFKQKRHLKYHQKIHNFKSLSIESNLIIDPNTDMFQLQYEQDDESNGSFELKEEPANGKKSMGIENRPTVLYQCNQCPKVYSQKCNLYQHQRTHTPNYPCDICQKKFKIEQNLHEHMKTHTLADCFGEQ